MKNIHVLPTDQPSRLFYDKVENRLIFSKIGTITNDTKSLIRQKIYITSDEEIKEGDWTLMFDDYGNLFLCDKPQQYLGIEKGHHLNKGLRKIILTDHTDLINDGVQAIDDEFLEWFVKNPSCEYVPIIPPLFGHGYIIWFDNLPKKEPKQETLEEAAEIILLGEDLDLSDYDKRYILKAMVNIAKWQAERMYSEEDMTNYALYILHNNVITPKEWFEQFKKK